jgi:hypothetical protein
MGSRIEESREVRLIGSKTPSVPSMAQRIINDPNQEGFIDGENIKIDDRWPAGYYGDETG